MSNNIRRTVLAELCWEKITHAGQIGGRVSLVNKKLLLIYDQDGTRILLFDIDAKIYEFALLKSEFGFFDFFTCVVFTLWSRLVEQLYHWSCYLTLTSL